MGHCLLMKPMIRVRQRSWLACLSVLLCAAFLAVPDAISHLGSPDIYLQGNAGPYPVLISILPPTVIPGIAQIQVRSTATDVDQVLATPMPLTGIGSLHPPAPDFLSRSTADPQFFSGQAWIMASGSWQVRIAVRGKRGDGTLSVPLPAVAATVGTLRGPLRDVLIVLGLLLVLGFVGIVGTALREAQLFPGATASPQRKRDAALGMTIALAITAGVLWFGGRWWRQDAADSRNQLYSPLQMDVSLQPGGLLDLRLHPPTTESRRSGKRPSPSDRPLSDLVPDHDHLMHLYLVRQPKMDFALHLHPTQTAPGRFALSLPNMPAGTYSLFADVVHADGFPETAVASAALPQQQDRPLQGDDSSGALPSLSSANDLATAFHLPDGYTLTFDRPSSIHPQQAQLLRFHLLDPRGQPPADMANYMGMAGHAAILKDDGSVFAHIHPSGSISMAALMMANQAPTSASSKPMDPEMDMGASASKPSYEADFPYGFPTAGRYRILVQMKHGNTVETAAFDLVVSN